MTGSGFSRTKWALGSLGWAVQPGLGRQTARLSRWWWWGLKWSGNILGFRDLVSVLIAPSKLLRKSLSLDLAEESFPLAYCQRHFPWSNSSQACSHVDTGDMTVVLPVLHLNCQQNSINNIMEQITKKGNHINQLLFYIFIYINHRYSFIRLQQDRCWLTFGHEFLCDCNVSI